MAWPCKSPPERLHAFAVETPFSAVRSLSSGAHSRDPLARTLQESSRRTPGPITTAIGGCAKVGEQRLSKQTMRRMGPCFRRDDAGTRKPHNAVPANAGTHNHSYQWLRESRRTVSLKTSGTAYGSLLSQGRRRQASVAGRRMIPLGLFPNIFPFPLDRTNL